MRHIANAFVGRSFKIMNVKIKDLKQIVKLSKKTISELRKLNPERAYNGKDLTKYQQELAQLKNEISVREQHINVLQDAVKEFLRVINRSPAALHHYADAIKKGEEAIGESVTG